MLPDPRADCSVGPNVFKISPEVPEGCKVDQAVYISRHGSRYPDPGAYEEWLALYAKVSRLYHTCCNGAHYVAAPIRNVLCERPASISAGLEAGCGVSRSSVGTIIPWWIRGAVRSSCGVFICEIFLITSFRYDFGVELRTRYPGWYRPDAPFRVWANQNPRVVDSAR